MILGSGIESYFMGFRLVTTLYIILVKSACFQCMNEKICRRGWFARKKGCMCTVHKPAEHTFYS